MKKNISLEQKEKTRISKLEKKIEKARKIMDEVLTSINLKGYKWKKSNFAYNESPVLISDYMSGKMEGIPAISSSCMANNACIARMRNANNICAYCFATNTLTTRNNVEINCLYNTFLLNEKELENDEIPRFHRHINDYDIARIEAFGDVASWLQAFNYLKIIDNNKHVSLTIV